MGSLLRPRRQCFYCNHRTSKTVPKHARKWQCENCAAVNYLDEDGQITDPPSEEVASADQSSQRYAAPISAESEDGSLFCRTCLMNQQIYTHLLSSYLPPATDPDYARREAELPSYKKELEERYPQVCHQCEPRVRARIQQTGYEAKTDHLRRLMERSRSRRIAHRWGWRNLIVKTGCLGQIMSLSTHFIWTVSVIITGLNRGDAGSAGGSLSRPISCLQAVMNLQRCPDRCSQVLFSSAGWGLIAGLLTIWWNPRWHDKLEGREGRLQGLTRCYRLQSLALIIRFTVWLSSQKDATHFSRPIWIYHVVSSPVIAMLAALAVFAVKFDTKPLVSWQMEVPPLIAADGTSRDPSQKSSAGYLQNNHDLSKSSKGPTFPINNLGPNTSRERESSPVPSFAGSELDSMEWEPSQLFRPTAYEERYPQRIMEPSPFHGRLPPAPARGAIGRNIDNNVLPKDSIGLAPGHFDKRNPLLTTTMTAIDTTFAPPKFFPDQQSDTGLESIFGKVFSLGDNPLGAPEPRQTTQTAPNLSSASFDVREVSPTESWSSVHILCAALLASAFIAWFLADHLPSWSADARVGVLLFTSVMSALLLLKTTNEAKTPQNRTVTVVYLLETVILATIAAQRLQQAQQPGFGTIDHLVGGLLALMAWQEVYVSVMSSSVSGSTPFTLEDQSPHTISSPIDQSSSQTMFQPSLPASKPASGPRPFQPQLSNQLAQQQQQQQHQHHHHQQYAAALSRPSTTALPNHNQFGRPRNDSADSITSADESDTGTTITTATSASRTADLRARYQRAQSPGLGLGLGGLRLDEPWGSGSGYASGFGGGGNGNGSGSGTMSGGGNASGRRYGLRSSAGRI